MQIQIFQTPYYNKTILILSEQNKLAQLEEFKYYISTTAIIMASQSASIYAINIKSVFCRGQCLHKFNTAVTNYNN